MQGFPHEIETRVSSWLNGPFDELTKKEIKRLAKENPNELIDCFSKNLAFGTGGMRGLMGVGPNRLNIYTVRRAGQGLALFLLDKYKKLPPHKLSVVIGYDSRHHSHEFALEAAKSLAAHQITSYLCKEPTPTPFVSFACRHQKSVAAIMITASHNPLDYNGVKVYGKDGAQVVSPDDVKIEEQVALQEFTQIKLAPETDPLIKPLPEETEQDYLHSLKKLQLHRREDQELGDELYIIYSALHGVGTNLVVQALHEWGFTHVSLVESQALPDGNFPTVKKPNPEEKEALALGIAQLKSEKADLFIATDPDADRLGVVVMHKERPHILTGNQVACICLYHILTSFKELRVLSPKSGVITTIVSTPLFKVIANHFNVKCFEVLTGFKFIAELIHKWEMGIDTHTFLFGAEESYGYLFGTHARDKDAVISACLIAEIATLYKMRSLTLIDALESLYEEFGIFREGQIFIDFPNAQPDHMKKLLDHMRENPLLELEKKKVTHVHDYMNSAQRPKTIPESDLLIIDFADQIRLILRPSGTEPKMKIYGMIQALYQDSLEIALLESDKKLNCRLKAMKSYLEKISV